jgi:NAD(P)-dependent dehydrogenase (short-subunit alcohol dehydrogenase family)
MDKPKEFPDQHQSQPGDQHKMRPEPEIIGEQYRGSQKLQGKKALISGGDSGIGRSVAVHFAREGADIALIHLKEDRDARTTRGMVEREGGKCVILHGDLKQESFCRTAVEQCVAELGGLNILVNNAAVQFPQDRLEDISTEQLETTFNTNFHSYFHLTKYALHHLGENDAIINTSSVTAYRGNEHLVDYSSTKGAIVSFTRALSKMLAKRKIRVNGVAPGPIWTPLIPASFDDVTKFGQQTPMGRAGQPSEVAPAYVFLACGDSSYISGQFIHVNGGEIIGG